MTGRLGDRHAAWEERERRNQAVQQLVRLGSAEQIRTSPLTSIETRVGPIAPREGPSAAVVAEAIYAACGARMGAALVNPNMVVTLAGLRGHTEFGLVNPLSRDAEGVLVADRVGREFGVRFREVPGRDWLDRPLLFLEVESLPGYEYASHLTRMPGSVRFCRRAGWPGLGSWARKVYRGLQIARARGQISRLVDVRHALLGLEKGYPDVAILRYLEVYAVEVDEVTTIDSDIPLARAYECGEPNYSYPPELDDHPDIVAHRQLWNDALLDFYTSDWHLAIRHEPAFREARRTAYDL